MMSVLREGGGVSQFLTIGGGGCVISILEILTGGGGVENPENWADVICTWPQMAPQPHLARRDGGARNGRGRTNAACIPSMYE